MKQARLHPMSLARVPRGYSGLGGSSLGGYGAVAKEWWDVPLCKARLSEHAVCNKVLKRSAFGPSRSRYPAFSFHAERRAVPVA